MKIEETITGLRRMERSWGLRLRDERNLQVRGDMEFERRLIGEALALLASHPQAVGDAGDSKDSDRCRTQETEFVAARSRASALETELGAARAQASANRAVHRDELARMRQFYELKAGEARAAELAAELAANPWKATPPQTKAQLWAGVIGKADALDARLAKAVLAACCQHFDVTMLEAISLRGKGTHTTAYQMAQSQLEKFGNEGACKLLAYARSGNGITSQRSGWRAVRIKNHEAFFAIRETIHLCTGHWGPLGPADAEALEEVYGPMMEEGLGHV